MAGGKETPRQKMVGMMYLVLTALLALNVSKSVLDAFVKVNSGLEVTNKSFEEKNETLYSKFESQMQINPDKTRPYKVAADEVKKLSKEMYDYAQDVKKRLIIACDGTDELIDEKMQDMMLVNSKDNYDIPSMFLCGGSNDGKTTALGETTEGEKLRIKLQEYRTRLIEILKDPNLQVLNKEQELAALGNLGIDAEDPTEDQINPEDPTTKYWGTSRFAHMATVAAACIISQIQNSIKNAESDVVSVLIRQIGAADFKFDTLAAKVIAKTNYVIRGNKYEADLFVAAFSTTEDPQVLIGDKLDTTKIPYEFIGPYDSVPVTKGMGHYEVPASVVGEKKKTALIKLKDPMGNWKDYPIDLEWMVAEPAVVVSPTKMNVFYIGVENPVRVSVSGFPDSRVFPSINNGGTLSKDKDGYIAKINKAGTCEISVAVADDEGNKKPMGKVEFRVKRVPDPVAKVGGQKDGDMKKNILTAQKGIVAEMENFDFDLKFNIISFTLSASVNGFMIEKSTNGYAFTDEQKNVMKALSTGSKVFIENIKAKGPDGQSRKLAPIILKLK